jgi:acyl carrier protein
MIDPDELRHYVNSKLIVEKDLRADYDSSLFNDGYLDSVAILSLIGYIERKLGRRLKEEEINLENFTSIRAIVNAFHA